jgi:hypothetical protein
LFTFCFSDTTVKGVEETPLHGDSHAARARPRRGTLYGDRVSVWLRAVRAGTAPRRCLRPSISPHLGRARTASVRRESPNLTRRSGAAAGNTTVSAVPGARHKRELREYSKAPVPVPPPPRSAPSSYAGCAASEAPTSASAYLRWQFQRIGISLGISAPAAPARRDPPRRDFGAGWRENVDEPALDPTEEHLECGRRPRPATRRLGALPEVETARYTYPSYRAAAAHSTRRLAGPAPVVGENARPRRRRRRRRRRTKRKQIAGSATFPADWALGRGKHG